MANTHHAKILIQDAGEAIVDHLQAPGNLLALDADVKQIRRCHTTPARKDNIRLEVRPMKWARSATIVAKANAGLICLFANDVNRTEWESLPGFHFPLAIDSVAFVEQLGC
ncbi:MAG: hypothetical protein WBD31_26200 [Rubripirellula sp.]